MLQELSNLVVADNTGAKRAMCFRILKQRKEYAHLGDVIRVAIKEASPTSSIKKGSVATAVIVRTGNPIRREDGEGRRLVPRTSSRVRQDHHAHEELSCA